MRSLARKLEVADVVVCTGIGKSGDVARLGASLLQSVGVKAQFIHATDLLHGGIGVFNGYPDNEFSHLIAFSHSGITSEILNLFPHIPPQVGTVMITSANTSMAAETLTYRFTVDGSIHGTIPVNSAIAQVRVVGDLACQIANVRTAEQLLDNHPAGKLAIAYAKEIKNG